MDEIKVDNVPTTIICSKAANDITSYLEDIMVANQISADLACMILRDASSHFERMRADNYSMAIVKDLAQIEALQKENTDLKKATELFNMEETTNDNSENEC